MRLRRGAGDAAAVAVMLTIVLVGVHSQKRERADANLFEDVTTHHYKVASSAMQSVRAPSLLALEQQAVHRAEQMKGLDNSNFEQTRPPSEAKLAEDEDHGHVPTTMILEALKLAKERDGKYKETSGHLHTQLSTQTKVPLWQIQLAEKLAKQQGQDHEKFTRQQQTAEPNDEEAEDQDHGHVPASLTALYKKLVQQKQEEDEQLNRPLAEEMKKEGYLREKGAVDPMAERAVDHTNLETMKEAQKELGMKAIVQNKRSGPVSDTVVNHAVQKSHTEDYIKEASEAKTERDADDAKIEKPLADQMARQGYLREKGAVDPMVERAVDHTKITASIKEASEITGVEEQRGAATSNAQVGQKLNNGSPEDYIKEAIDAKAERDAEIVKIEKEVQEGTEKRPKVLVDERAVDHTKMPVDYIKEAVDAKAQRDADDSKVEKPLADQMVRQGYLREKGAAARMAERAVDHTKITASMMKEASEITGVEVQHDVTTTNAQVGQQLNSQGDDYIKEAMDAKAERDADDAKVEKPLADQMVRQGYLREKGAVDPMVERAVDHTKVTASMKEASELTGHKQQHDATTTDAPAGQKLNSQGEDYIKEAIDAKAERDDEIAKVEKEVQEGTEKRPNVDDRAVDHTKMPAQYAKEVATLTGAHQQRTTVNDEVGQKVNNGEPKAVDYIKDAIEAKAERDADDAKVEKPLAEQMVRQGYLQKKGFAARMAERAVDHTKITASMMKEASEITGVEEQHQTKATTAEVGQKLKNGIPKGTDYIKDAMEAKADRDADDAKIEKEEFPQDNDPRAVDHTKLPAAYAKEVATVTGARHAHVGQKLNNRSPEGTDYVKEAKEAEAERDADDAKVEKPLAEQMVRQGYLQKKGFAARMAERAVDHTKITASMMKEASEITGVEEQRGAATSNAQVGQKLNNRSPAEGTDYVQEAKEAEAERDSDDAKIEKPLADQMVREGYLSNKHKLEDRAVDHTKMSSEYMKEASEIGVKEQHQTKATTAEVGQKLKNGIPKGTDYIKDAMEAKADRDADDAKIEKEEFPQDNDPRAVDHTKLPAAYAKEVATVTGAHREPKAVKDIKEAKAEALLSQVKPSSKVISKVDIKRALQIADRSVWHDKSVGNPKIAQLSVPNHAPGGSRFKTLSKEDVEKALLIADRSVWHDKSAEKPHTVSRLSQASKSPAFTPAQQKAEAMKMLRVVEGAVYHDKFPAKKPTTTLPSKQSSNGWNNWTKETAQQKKEEVQRILRMADRSVWHDTSGKEMHLNQQHRTKAQVKQAKLAQETKLINLAMKAEQERNDEEEKTEQNMSRDMKAESKLIKSTALAVKPHNSIVHNKLVETAIKEQEEEQDGDENEMRKDNEALVATHGQSPAHAKSSIQDNLLKLAERAMGEQNADEAAKLASEKKDDEAEEAVTEAMQEAKALEEAKGIPEGGKGADTDTAFSGTAFSAGTEPSPEKTL